MNALASMQQQIEQQAHTIRLLRAAIEPDVPFPTEWNLTRRESQIFVLLVRRERQTLQSLHGAIYASHGLDDVSPMVVQSHISKMRVKLRPFGVEIEAKRNLGYRLIGRSRFAHLIGAVA